MRCRDGSVIWVENEAVAVRDDEGRLLHYQGTLKNITERKFAEEALWESERNFRMLVEHAPVAIFCLSPERFQYLNRAGLSLFKADTPDQLMGRSIFDFLLPGFHPIAEERKGSCWRKNDRRLKWSMTF